MRKRGLTQAKEARVKSVMDFDKPRKPQNKGLSYLWVFFHEFDFLLDLYSDLYLHLIQKSIQ